MPWHARLELDYTLKHDTTVLHHRHNGPLRIFQSLYPEGKTICHNVVVHPPGGLANGDVVEIIKNPHASPQLSWLAFVVTGKARNIIVAAALMFAVYSLMTRLVARRDAASVSFFWTGITGAIAMTPIGLWSMHPMTTPDWGWMALLCCTAMIGHTPVTSAVKA